MDFLTSAFFENSSQHRVLDGLLITRFIPSKFTSRPTLQYYTLEEFRNATDMEPQGFEVKDPHILYSDVPAVSYVGEDQLNTLKQIVKTQDYQKSLIDVILWCSEIGASIVPQYKDGINKTVSMTALKVAENNFNIYVPYESEDGFKTLSLVDTETNTSIPFYACIPQAAYEKAGALAKFMHPENKVIENGMQTVRVEAPLVSASVFNGEAFCNRIADELAFYKIGINTMNYLLPPPPVKKSQSKEAAQLRFKPVAPSVIIKSSVSSFSVKKNLELIKGKSPEEVDALTKTNRGIEYMRIWINHISKKAGVTSPNGDTLIAAKYAARNMHLKYSLELLAQRLYIYEVGIALDPTGVELKGGGTNGIAIKEFTW